MWVSLVYWLTHARTRLPLPGRPNRRFANTPWPWPPFLIRSASRWPVWSRCPCDRGFVTRSVEFGCDPVFSMGKRFCCFLWFISVLYMSLVVFKVIKSIFVICLSISHLNEVFMKSYGILFDWSRCWNVLVSQLHFELPMGLFSLSWTAGYLIKVWSLNMCSLFSKQVEITY